MSIPPKITGVLEAALYAADLDRAEAFYHGVLNMEVVLRLEQRHVFFRAGQTILLVFNPEETAKPSQNTRMPVPAHGAHGPGHVCFRASRDEISRWRAHVLDQGIAVDAEFDWPNGARSLYIRDPAGNSVEFAEPHLWF
ncbi:MAG: VOC family protein [Marinovum algicola]|jgi:catechol 2,3-dioxygenase-like lactoylglutathione lyase family enzyme|uniref:Glyoxalase-like domain-containing protein n=1 Tax=Marinovum algicola TaxID=42444 RepID=A0A975W796_9RHOB|nr:MULTISPECIES: VOC family protein [Marinovum]MDD9739067.1 VOC family protein [Marinovum sp. SP66]SEI80661.1 Glyoxalase-like domain-containing protein [Marinovum algicola]SLN16391.1 Glyoxalase-like domain protein [Marinovum algicola]